MATIMWSSGTRVAPNRQDKSMSPYSSSSCVVYPPGVKSIRAKTASSFPGLLPQNKSSLSGIVLHNSCPLFLSILSDLLWLFVALVTILPAGPLIHSQTLTRQWSTRVVNTKLGLTRGFLFLPRGGHEGVEVFLGIPYASAPLGSLRLMPPVSGAPWTGIKMNEQYPPVCPQVMPSGLHNFGGLSTSTISEESGGHKSSGGGGKGNLTAEEEEALKWMPRGRLAQLRRLFPFLTNQSEDCLYLSVYVPLSVADGREEKPLPVLVFIHGEDFGYGAGNAYDPSMLVSQGNIVAVTLNYRLGILGFLNANSDGYFKSPANFALLDQIAALHWVQENIGAFGGDRGNVTLMGQGKGAAFVNFLMISNALPKELLFHRVILMSGSALSPLSVGLSNGKDLAKKFAARVKCPIEPPSNMLQCLRKVPLQYFLQSELWPYFGPSDDGVVIEHGIRENILRDKLSLYPMLFGVTRAEILPTLGEHDAVYGLETEKRREVLKQLVDGFFSLHRGEILAAAVHEYTDWERPVQHPISVRDETLDALADAQIVSPLMKVGELHSQGNSQTFFYVFEYQSKVSDFTQRLGCVPGEDLSYVFGVPLYISWNDYAPAPLPQQQLSSATSSASNVITESHHWNNKVRDGGGPSGAGGSSNNNLIGSGSSSYSTTIVGATEPDPHRLGLFTGNFTRNEVQLSLTLVHYWANFIRTGNPNAEFAEGSTHGFSGREGSKGSSSSGESMMASSSGGGSSGNRYPSQPSSPQQQGPPQSPQQQLLLQFAKPKLIDWPPYDTLFKKYLSIEAKPRVRNHYRAHKLSFWLHLVPELMRNGFYNGNGYPLGSTGGFPTRSNNNNHNFNGNYTTPHSPTIELVGPWEQKPYYYVESNSSYGGDISGPLLYPPGRHPYYHDHHNHHDGDGYQIYSTALTVTIAVGCSLLILNILVFAAFYYYRDKRRNRRGRRSGSGNNSSSPDSTYHPGHAQQTSGTGLSITGENLLLSSANHQEGSLSTMDLQLQEISGGGQAGSGGGGGSVMMGHLHHHPSGHIFQDVGQHQQQTLLNQQQQQHQSGSNVSHHPVPSSLQNTPVRFQQQQQHSLKENGQILNLRHHLQQQQQQPPIQMPLLPMPNICGELGATQQVPNLQQFLQSAQQHQQHPQQHKLPPQQQQYLHQVASNQQRTGNKITTSGSNSGKGTGSVNLSNLDFSTMPDAILAAAMMLNYRQTPPTSISSDGSVKSVGGGGVPVMCPVSSSTMPRKSALNMKEQLLISAGIMGTSPGGAGCITTLGRQSVPTGMISQSGSPSLGGTGVVTTTQAKHQHHLPHLHHVPGSQGTGVSNVIQFDNTCGGGGVNVKSVPRPPKRHTPTVKFSPDTFTNNPCLQSSTELAGNGGASSFVGNTGNVVTLSSVMVPTGSPGAGAPNNKHGNVVHSNVTAINQQNAPGVQQTTTLKSSLKKNSSYSQLQPGNPQQGAATNLAGTPSASASNQAGLPEELKV